MENKISALGKMALVGLLAGAASLAGCDKDKERDLEGAKRSGVTYVETTGNVIVEPHYGDNFSTIDGLTVRKFSHGNGLSLPPREIVEYHEKGTPEYEALRPFLTSERQIR